MWRASVGLSLLSLGTQLLQLGLQIVLARRYGSGAAVDAYVAAVTGPQLVLALLVGPAAPLAVPALARALERSGRDYAGLRDGLLLWGGALAALCAVGLACNPSGWLALAAPGLEAPALALAPGYLLLAAPALVPAAWVGLLTPAHHARGRLALPALAGLASSALLVVAFLALHRRFGLEVLLVGQLLGQLGVAATLAVSEWRAHAPRLRWREPELARLARLALPIAVIAANVRISIAVDRWFASQLDAGSLAVLYYAERWIGLSHAVLAMPLVAVLYSQLSRDLAAGRDGEHGVGGSLAATLFAGLPLAVGTWVIAPDLARALLAGGGATPEAAPLLAACLRGYVGALALGAYGSLMVRVFYARGDVRTPLWLAGVFPVLLNLGLDSWAAPRFGAVGLAWATSAGALIVLALLSLVLVRREPARMAAGVGASALRALVGCTSLVGAAALAGLTLPPGLPRLVCVGLLGPLGFLGLAAASGSREARELSRVLRGQVAGGEARP